MKTAKKTITTKELNNRFLEAVKLIYVSSEQ